jgi:hypothetical protein
VRRDSGDHVVKMKQINCAKCGSNDLASDGGYVVCGFCRSRWALQADELPRVETVIDMDSDIQALLQKCVIDPVNRRRYAALILDIDPTNQQAYQHLR